MNFLIQEFSTDLDIFSIFSIFKNYKEVAFLDSSKIDSKYSEYSIIGINPYLNLKSIGKEIFLNDNKFIGNPFDFLEKELQKESLPKETSELFNLPFSSGAIGYFSYDAAMHVEPLILTAKDDIKIPEVYFNFYDNFIIYDIKRNKYFITAMGKLKPSNKSIFEILKLISESKEIKIEPFVEGDTEFQSNFEPNEYIETVEKVREYIRSGDIYITNLTQRFKCHCEKDSYDIYKNLRSINPAPFSSYLAFDDFQIMSSSPERFLQIKNKIVETRPIKGTRPRGNTALEDEENRLELLNSEKDKSELLMIVDLERNDLSKVCKPFSVKVTELFKLEEYSTVFHLVSTIIGELKDEVSSVKCIKECFPGGSITGAPKIRSMEIIDELEKIKRNIYTGAIGYFDFNGNSDFNIVIRTILKKDNTAYFGVGGGITWESEKESEYYETLDKAKALMRVLR
ncbi:MAG: aminodeoxychorismate synthase component I [Fusobacteriaceae bacterium]